MIGNWLKKAENSNNLVVAPLKNIGGQNMQNFGRFFAPSDFDCEYLWNGLRYPSKRDIF